MENIVIRAYKPEDQASVLQLLRLNTPEYFAPEEEKDLVYYLDNEIDQYYVLEYNGMLVGSGSINFSHDKSLGKISWDIFHPAYQGKGLGGRLLKFRIGQLKALGHIKRISVRTSQVAYQFYEKQGFRVVETVKGYWADGFDLYRMEYADI
jgi:[ribosomal protein S18]-alanine N-acetyltransferase